MSHESTCLLSGCVQCYEKCSTWLKKAALQAGAGKFMKKSNTLEAIGYRKSERHLPAQKGLQIAQLTRSLSSSMAVCHFNCKSFQQSL